MIGIATFFIASAPAIAQTPLFHIAFSYCQATTLGQSTASGGRRPHNATMRGSRFGLSYGVAGPLYGWFWQGALFW
jgi:hypothetical protein